VISEGEGQSKGGRERSRAGRWEESGTIRGKSRGTEDEQPWTRQASQQTAAWHLLVKTAEKHYQCP